MDKLIAQRGIVVYAFGRLDRDVGLVNAVKETGVSNGRSYAREREGLLNETYAGSSVDFGFVCAKVGGSEDNYSEMNVILAVGTLGEVAVVFILAELALNERVDCADIPAFGSGHKFCGVSALPVVDVDETFEVERAVTVVVLDLRPSAEDDAADDGVCEHGILDGKSCAVDRAGFRSEKRVCAVSHNGALNGAIRALYVDHLLGIFENAVFDRELGTLAVVVVGRVDELSVAFAVLEDYRLIFAVHSAVNEQILENRLVVVSYGETVIAAVVNVAIDDAVDVDVLRIAVENAVEYVAGGLAFRRDVVLENDVLGSLDSLGQTRPVGDVDAVHSVHLEGNGAVSLDILRFGILGLVLEREIAGGVYREDRLLERSVCRSQLIFAAGKRNGQIDRAFGTDVIVAFHEHREFFTFDNRSGLVFARNCRKAHRADDCHYQQCQYNFFLHNILLKDIHHLSVCPTFVSKLKTDPKRDNTTHSRPKTCLTIYSIAQLTKMASVMHNIVVYILHLPTILYTFVHYLDIIITVRKQKYKSGACAPLYGDFEITFCLRDPS